MELVSRQRPPQKTTRESRYSFGDIVDGWPGSVHDARVLSNSEIYNLGNDGALFPDIKETILGQDIQHIRCFLGF